MDSESLGVRRVRERLNRRLAGEKPEAEIRAAEVFKNRAISYFARLYGEEMETAPRAVWLMTQEYFELLTGRRTEINPEVSASLEALRPARHRQLIERMAEDILVIHPTAESVARAYLSPMCDDLPPGYDLADVSMGGETFDGEERAFTAADMVDAHEAAGLWGFADLNTGQIHAWARPGVEISRLIHFFAHELEHLTPPIGEQDGPELEEEMRCERAGEMAARAYELAQRFAGRSQGESVAWRCFHCDELFTDSEAAREHFGADQMAQPGCLIEGGPGVLAELRKMETERDEWRDRALELEGKEEQLEGLYADMRHRFGTHSLWDIADRLSNERFRADHAMELLQAAGIAFDQPAPTPAERQALAERLEQHAASITRYLNNTRMDDRERDRERQRAIDLTSAAAALRAASEPAEREPDDGMCHRGPDCDCFCDRCGEHLERCECEDDVGECPNCGEGYGTLTEARHCGCAGSGAMNAEGCTCQGCGRTYRADMLVPDALWAEIKPEGKPEGAGLLCGRCIVDRLEAQGFGAYHLSLPDERERAWLSPLRRDGLVNLNHGGACIATGLHPGEADRIVALINLAERRGV